jgi:signal transduction histidine kinase
MTDPVTDKFRIKQASLSDIRQKLLTPVSAIVGYSELLYDEAREENLEAMLPDL